MHILKSMGLFELGGYQRLSGPENALGVNFTYDGILKHRKESISRYYLIPLESGDPLYTPEDKRHATP